MFTTMQIFVVVHISMLKCYLKNGNVSQQLLTNKSRKDCKEVVSHNLSF